MGSATTICSEKTGTLTNSHMTIEYGFLSLEKAELCELMKKLDFDPCFKSA
ncbi:hypothetical protein YC2023_051156 [Brassica napus]